MGKLSGKIAVITGGSAGMGLATAKLFGEEGAKVIITGRNQAALDEAAQSIGGDVEAFRGDISKVADIEALTCRGAIRSRRCRLCQRGHGEARTVRARVGK
jgi:NAD(P)-dependent dehydrogenase (short-subunit alcohol dehydrogenase family)